jgi:hypothetical protein
MRYLLSLLFPVPMRSTHLSLRRHRREDIEAGIDGAHNHFLTDDHHDLVSIRWWQWRGRCFAQRTVKPASARWTHGTASTKATRT